VEQLKKTRFQLHYTREAEDSLKKDYGSLKNLLESVGIDDTDSIKEEYLSMNVTTIPTRHAISVILDIKKMKDLMKETSKKDLDEAVASEKVIHCFDSSRILGYTVKVNDSLVRYNMGALHKNCDFVNVVQQELGSCWFHAVASTLTAMKHPELVEKIRNGEIKPYNVEHRALENNDKINDFQLRQMNTIRKMSEKFNIGFTQDGRGTIDVLVDNRTQEEVKKMPFPDVAREVLGIKTENKAEEIGDKKGQTDFSHSVRVIDGRSRAIEKLSKKTESSDKIIKRNLRAEKKPTLYGAKEKSVDDIVMRYGRNEFDTFASREEKKKNEKNIAI
jgi:hypothetical protein